MEQEERFQKLSEKSYENLKRNDQLKKSAEISKKICHFSENFMWILGIFKILKKFWINQVYICANFI